MKKLIVSLLIPLSLSICSAESSALVNKTGAGPRGEVFKDLTHASAPQGLAELQVIASFKTHQPGLYSSSELHGTEDYRLQLTIDGQSMVVDGELQSEHLAVPDARDPEAGLGIRYRFRKVVSLKGGSHRIEVSLPGENIVLARDIFVQEGRENRLVLEPVYGRVNEKKRPSASKSTDFKEGISRIILTLNGKRI